MLFACMENPQAAAEPRRAQRQAEHLGRPQFSPPGPISLVGVWPCEAGCSSLRPWAELHTPLSSPATTCLSLQQVCAGSGPQHCHLWPEGSPSGWLEGELSGLGLRECPPGRSSLGQDGMPRAAWCRAPTLSPRRWRRIQEGVPLPRRPGPASGPASGPSRAPSWPAVRRRLPTAAGLGRGQLGRQEGAGRRRTESGPRVLRLAGPGPLSLHEIISGSKSM